jgi:exopolysaccharide biosynthesis WecB/TagA/CpsF family protein
MLAAHESRRLGPLSVRVETAAEATRDIVLAVLHKRPLRVAFANTHLLYCAVREPTLATTLSGFYVVNDGVGIALMSRLACGRGFSANLNGTDLTPRIMAALPWGTRIALVGAKREVVERMAERASRLWPQLDVCARYDGYEDQARALSDLATLKPDIALVAMGNPLQERWVEVAATVSPNTVFLGVGALFDFIAGDVPRAPPLVRRFRLEWAFRLAREPERLWRRYTVEILVVVASLLTAPASKARA